MKNILMTGAILALVGFGLSAETMKIGSTAYTVNRRETQLAPGVKYTHLSFPDRTYTSYNSGTSVHVVEADLTEPTVSVEMVTTGLSGTRTLAKHAESASVNGKKAVAGANGNFWITSEKPWNNAMSKMPWGVAISNGEMYTDPNAKTIAHVGGPVITGMIAIDADGRCIIDRLLPQQADVEQSGFNFSVTNHRIGHTFDLDMCNRCVNPGTASIYTKTYGANKTFKPVDGDYNIVEGVCTELLCDIVDADNLIPGGKTKYVIKEIRTNAGTGTLGSHDLAIVGRDSYASVTASNYRVGDELTVSTKMNFESGLSPVIKQAVSGNILIMKGGVKVSPDPQEGYDKNSNERTLYATNAEGNKLWIIVAEHNVKQQKKYFGLSTSQMCDIALAFGATEASQVDCGGSAQMYAGSRQVSESYDAAGIRAVHNGMFIMSTADKSLLNEVPQAEPDPVPSSPVTAATAGKPGPSSYELELSYADVPVAEIEGKTVRRVIGYRDVLYILAYDAAGKASVTVFNHKEQKVLRTLDCSTCQGNTEALSDIALTEDGYLIGTSHDTAALANVFVLFYKWNNADDGYATGVAGHWNVTTQGGNWSNNDSGASMTYAGTTKGGYIYYSSKSATASGIRWARVRVNNEKLDEAYYNLPPTQFAGVDQYGASFQLNPAPWNHEEFIIDSPVITPQTFNFVSAVRGQMTVGTSTSQVDASLRTSVFKHNGTYYMTCADAAGMQLLEINNGLSGATPVLLTAPALPVHEGADMFGVGASDSEGKLALCAVRGAKISKYSPKEAAQIVYGDRAHSAYNLEMEGDKENGYDFYYTLTGNVESVTLHLHPMVSRAALSFEGTTEKGLNSIHVGPGHLGVGEQYTWSLEVQSYPVENGGKIHSHSALTKADARGGVGVVTNPESDAYGCVVTTHGYAQGFYMYSPELEYIGNYQKGHSVWTASNRSDLYRIGMREGRVAYASAFSDKGAGFWEFDPENPDKGARNLAGGVNDGTGCFKLADGTVVGSGSSAVAFTGSGENTKVWSFAEDYPSGNHANKGTLVRWHLGTADNITSAAEKDFAAQRIIGTALIGNQRCQLTPWADGMFVSQYRTSDTATGTPGIIYVDADGNVTYNSATDANIPSTAAGFALSADGTRAAVAVCKGNIRLFNVSWNGSTPTLSYAGEVPGSANSAHNEVHQLAFDTAGNVLAVFHHTTSTADNALQAFAVPGRPAALNIPAKASFVAVGPDHVVAVETVVADPEAAVEWYTLQGVRVSGEDLRPGIYIRRQGSDVRKLLIR